MVDILSPLPQKHLERAPVDRVIDIHGHFGAPSAEKLLAGLPQRQAEFAAFAKATGTASAAHNAAVMLPAAGERFASLEKRLDDLEMMSVDLQIVSPSPTLFAYWADRDLASSLVDAVNTSAAELVSRAPTRLAAMASVSLQHPDLAAQQVLAAQEMGLVAVEMSASVADMELSDPRLDPFWEACAKAALPVFIHPLGSTLGSRIVDSYLSNTIGQPIETTIALSHMIFGGVFDRYPQLKVVAAHGGGYLPAYIGRSDHTWKVRPEAKGCTHLPSHYLTTNVWVDTVVFDPAQLTALVARMGPDRVMYGTDYPFDMADCRPADTCKALPKDTQDQVMGGAAASLFGV